MPIELDHLIVHARDRATAARRLAQLLDVPWEPEVLGIFAAVYVNDGLTLDFVSSDDPFPIEHYCFRVDDARFDAILARLQAAGIDYRSGVRGPVDHAVSTAYGCVAAIPSATLSGFRPPERISGTWRVWWRT